MISISDDAYVAGNFTAIAGDTYRLSDLFKAGTPTGKTIAGFRVALGAAGANGGTLQLDGQDVLAGTDSFSAEQFARLTYTTGAGGSQNIVVVAQTGTRQPSLPDGTLRALSLEIDSPAVQITANITGSRSINVLSALATAPGTDADIAGLVQQAGIFTGWSGSARSTLQTDGNFSAVGGDTYRMSDLFKASAPTGQTIAGFLVALGDAGANGGTLQLDGQDVLAGTTSFSAEQFARLTYTTGAGGSQNIVVVAQTGTRQPSLPDGTLGALSHEIDSPAVQITANATGSRSINAMNALITPPEGADAVIAGIVQQAGIFAGWSGSARSTLVTDGNFTAVTGDIYRMTDLFKANAPTGQTIAGFRVALGDVNVGSGDVAGTLRLDNQVTSRTSFSADEFSRLTYDTTGARGPQSLVVVAQTGTRQPSLPDGTLGALTHEIDSQAMQITANVDAAGSRSINAMNALITPPEGADAVIADIVQQAGTFAGWSGSARPTLLTDGNFTAITGDVFRMGDLFKASTPTGPTIAGFQVALGDVNVGSGDVGGTLRLDNQVTTRTSFSADEFSRLTYDTTGARGPQSLVVVAQIGTRQPSLPDGTLGALRLEIDSPPVQITANVNAAGSRSINVLSALTTAPETDADVASIVQQAGIFAGWTGSARSSLQTDGNFTAITGDVFRMSDLFKASTPAGQTIAGFRVALGDVNVGSGDVGGTLRLDNQVTTRTSFSADEYSRLTFDTTGARGPQSLVVVAQTGTRQPSLPDGTLGALRLEIDSPPVQITANVNAAGSRSINAMNALITPPEGADAVIASIVQQAGTFAGWSGSARPTLLTGLTPEPPLPLAALADATGSYRSAGLYPANTDTDLLSFYSAAIGNSVSPGLFASPGGPLATALLLLDSAATGAFQTADSLTAVALAIRAYNTTKSF